MWKVFSGVPKNKRKQHCYTKGRLSPQYLKSKCGMVINPHWLIEDNTNPKCKHCERILTNETNKQR